MSQAHEAPDVLITIKQAALMLSLGESTLRKRLNPSNGEKPLFEVIRIGRATRLRLSDVQDFVGGKGS